MTRICRYNKLSQIGEKREIILLKAFPCKWEKCTFCDYIEDNSTNESEINKENKAVLEKVTGCFGALEVINSGSCFELPQTTLNEIKQIIISKNIRKLFMESHWMYRDRLKEMKDFFGIEIVFITGIETFDDNFRNKVLKKGILFKDISEIKKYFQSVCIMVGIKGQTKKMIKNDIEILMNNFDHATVNLFVNNTTNIKADPDLQKWFKSEYRWLNKTKKIDVLWKNTDFKVGSLLSD